MKRDLTSISCCKTSDIFINLNTLSRLPLALKIEFSGSSKKDVYSVRVYLEKISSSNLARQQIHFPRYDAARYRELYNEKVRQNISR